MIALRVILAVVALTVTATADPKQDARAFYGQGQVSYAEGDYAAAAERFLAAYRLDADPAYLYNIAQAYRFAKRCPEAVVYYRKFLAAVPNPPNKDDVGKFLVEVTACAGSRLPTEPQLPDPKPEPKAEPKPQPVPAPTDPGSVRRTLGITGIAIGAVGIGVGIAFGVRIEHLDSEEERLCDGSCPPMVDFERARLADRAASARTFMFAGLIGGGLVAIAGTYLYVSGRASHSTVGIVPVSSGAVVTLSLTR